MNDLGIVILSGGFFHCTNKWNRRYLGGNGCYKLYFPVLGNGRVQLCSSSFDICAQHVCFINGYKLEEQVCDDTMDLYWIHFIPQSLTLGSCLARMPVFNRWEFSDIPFCKEDLEFIPALFNYPNSEENRPSLHVGLDIQCRVTSIIMYFISDMLHRFKEHIENDSFSSYTTLKSAIDYMDENYTSNLDLKSIAQCANLNPSYFNRLFKSNFNLTPFEYIRTKRMSRAWQLLTSTSLSISEISEMLGYSSQFHFSNMFKAYFGNSPNKLRNQKNIP